MKKYVYEYLKNIENYDGWNIEKIIEIEKDIQRVVLSKEDKPIQKEKYLSEATNKELIEELNKRLESEV